MVSEKIERFVAEDVSEVTKLRLKRLCSANLCEKILQNNYPEMNEEIIKIKAVGMASSVSSALGYWETAQGGVNSKVLSRYYALLHISIAEQISSDNLDMDLSLAQKYTKYGHGLYTINNEKEDFLSNFFVGCLKSGHFPEYCKNLGHEIISYASQGKEKTINEQNANSLISLSALFCRIPELQSVTFEYMDKSPLSFHIGHSNKNREERYKEKKANSKNVPTKTYVDIYTNTLGLSSEILNEYNLPIKNIIFQKSESEYESDRFIGEITHPEGELWWNFVETYKSSYSGTSVIVPFWGMTDPFVLHFIILYSLSIIVRYLPETWHEIEHGKLNQILALIEHYMVIVDKVLPRIAVERLTKTELIISQPGSLNSPI